MVECVLPGKKLEGTCLIHDFALDKPQEDLRERLSVQTPSIPVVVVCPVMSHTYASVMNYMSVDG